MPKSNTGPTEALAFPAAAHKHWKRPAAAVRTSQGARRPPSASRGHLPLLLAPPPQVHTRPGRARQGSIRTGAGAAHITPRGPSHAPHSRVRGPSSLGARGTLGQGLESPRGSAPLRPEKAANSTERREPGLGLRPDAVQPLPGPAARASRAGAQTTSRLQGTPHTGSAPPERASRSAEGGGGRFPQIPPETRGAAKTWPPREGRGRRGPGAGARAAADSRTGCGAGAEARPPAGQKRGRPGRKGPRRLPGTSESSLGGGRTDSMILSRPGT
ncbi:translation initiation factor IF-2-like [Canis lupus familiaris]|uniref:translation initiation factor IF-2-like n=1 Tax=Canis lupus familiaris TaxID=9615 RepID=UPI0018F4B8A6|nr:translation initiation factor IF-2-like [Canis lupus familiaris]